jgi:hypothetical protein
MAGIHTRLAQLGEHRLDTCLLRRGGGLQAFERVETVHELGAAEVLQFGVEAEARKKGTDLPR